MKCRGLRCLFSIRCRAQLFGLSKWCFGRSQRKMKQIMQNNLVIKLSLERKMLEKNKQNREKREESKVNKDIEKQEQFKNLQEVELKKKVRERLEFLSQKRSKEREQREKIQKEWEIKKKELGLSSQTYPKKVESIDLPAINRSKDNISYTKERNKTIDSIELMQFEQEYLEKKRLFAEQKRK